MNKKVKKTISEAILGKPIYFNDFDGSLGVMEQIGNNQFILEPGCYPQTWNFSALNDDLNWKFLGYAGEEIDAVNVLKVMGLMLENCIDDFVTSLCLLRERLEKNFVIHDEAFDLKVEVDYTGDDEVCMTVKHYVYQREKVMAIMTHLVLEPDFGINEWICLITTPVKQLYPSVNVIVKEFKHKKH